MSVIFSLLILIVVVILSIPFYRVVRGPTVFDRLLAIAAIGGKTVALILLFGLLFDRLSMFVDIALAYTLLNFIAAIAVAEYFRLGGSQR
jgi:multicomponent Na+:H+ antiporter subunit F